MTNNIVEIGKKTRFSSTNQPKNRGRKPKLYNIAASGYRVSKEEFADTANYVMQLPKEEAMKLAEKADTPMWVVLIIRSLYKSASKGDMRQLLDLAKMMGFDAPTELKIQKDSDGMSSDDVIKELGCISFFSYIKPQLTRNAKQCCAVVYRSFPTSNHNRTVF